MSRQDIDTGGGSAVRDVHTAGGSFVGRDDVEAKNGNAVVDNVTVNNYERRTVADTAALETKIESQISRLEDRMTSKIDALERDMLWKFELAARDIASAQKDGNRQWFPILTAIASLIMALALFYFGSGLYSLSSEMKLSREFQQRQIEMRLPRTP